MSGSQGSRPTSLGGIMRLNKIFIILYALALVLVGAETSMSQPRIVVDPLGIEPDLFCGEMLEHVINITNEGDQQLHFTVNIVYLVEVEGWIEVEPVEGEVDPDSDVDMIVTLFREGLFGGEYQAELHIVNNDPDNGDVVVDVLMSVTGVPVIEVVWDEQFGYPDLIDWNRAHDPVFNGTRYSVPVTIQNLGTDELIVHEISCDNPFFTADPVEFVVAVEDERVVEFTLRAERVGLHQSEMVFISNNLGEEEYSIHLRAETVDPPPFEVRLGSGWNMISAPVDPFEWDVIQVLNALVERENLILAKDGNGNFFCPQFEFSNIPFWDFRMGYLIKTHREDELLLVGSPVEPDIPIPLGEGWNMVAYFPEEEVEAPDAFVNIEEVLIMAKDGEGRFYIPEEEFNNIQPLRRGKGYMVKVSEEIELIWNVP